MGNKSEDIVEQNRIKLTATFIGAFVVVAVCAIAFVALASEILEQETPRIDTQILGFVRDLSTPLLDNFLAVATNIGGAVGVTILGLIISVMFLYKREYLRALIIAIGVFGAVALNLVLKSIFTRERPDIFLQLVHETGYSFPSGHAMSSAALGAAVVVALWHSRWRWWAVLGAAIYVILVGFSRIYLSVHYPTDVVAGWCVSVAWVLLVAIMLRSSLAKKVIARFKRA